MQPRQRAPVEVNIKVTGQGAEQIIDMEAAPAALVKVFLATVPGATAQNIELIEHVTDNGQCRSWRVRKVW